jgi:hypothetical protein
VSAHSPGTWWVWAGQDGSFEVWSLAPEFADRFIICSRNPIEHRAQESRANAALIGAASVLLAAAEAALAEMVNTIAPRNSFTDVVDLLDAAIAKAKGEPDATS